MLYIPYRQLIYDIYMLFLENRNHKHTGFYLGNINQEEKSIEGKLQYKRKKLIFSSTIHHTRLLFESYNNAMK